MSSSGWDKFRKQQATEREQLKRLLATMQPLLFKCRETAPTDIELSALAAALHSFDLDWRKLSPLVLQLDETFRRLEVALDKFVG